VIRNCHRIFILTACIVLASAGNASASAHIHRWFQPIAQLPKTAFRHFACIIYVESRSTFLRPNLGDNSRYGSSGIFQIEPILWNRWAPLGGVHVQVWQATPYEQAQVAATIYKYDGFSPWRENC
jgi:hypothetical protein